MQVRGVRSGCRTGNGGSGECGAGPKTTAVRAAVGRWVFARGWCRTGVRVVGVGGEVEGLGWVWTGLGSSGQIWTGPGGSHRHERAAGARPKGGSLASVRRSPWSTGRCGGRVPRSGVAMRSSRLRRSVPATAGQCLRRARRPRHMPAAMTASGAGNCAAVRPTSHAGHERAEPRGPHGRTTGRDATGSDGGCDRDSGSGFRRPRGDRGTASDTGTDTGTGTRKVRSAGVVGAHPPPCGVVRE